MTAKHDLYNKIAINIIRQQEKLIGSSLAWQFIARVPGISVIDAQTARIFINEDPQEAINALVGKCIFLWGKLGTYECKDAAADWLRMLDPSEIPEKLQ